MNDPDSRPKKVENSPADSGDSGAEYFTALLADLERGNREAADRLLPQVYAELRRLADRYMMREGPDHTLQPTALVHEAYIRLVEPGCRVAWQNRAHFVAIAARAMRQVLVNHAVSRRRQKRGGGAPKVGLDMIVAAIEERSINLIALDEALSKLAEIDSVQSQIVELRFFAGLTVQETARVLGVSPRTVDRESLIAKGWLHREIGKGG
jgi:RNA polymerase sigma factor (TIGR02999 family)